MCSAPHFAKTTIELRSGGRIVIRGVWLYSGHRSAVWKRLASSVAFSAGCLEASRLVSLPLLRAADVLTARPELVEGTAAGTAALRKQYMIAWVKPRGYEVAVVVRRQAGVDLRDDDLHVLGADVIDL